MAAPAGRHIVIAGGGSAGWMAAAALSRLLPRDWRVTLVESEAIGTVGVGEATIPGIRVFNAMLGVDEHEFLRATGGTYKLGIEFAGWGAPGERYLHGFGQVGRPLGPIDFFAYWRRWRAGGGQRHLWDFAPAALAAEAGRGGPPAHLKGVAWAYHFDAALYARFLRGRAEAEGVARHEGRIVAVERDGEGGNVTALTLESGERVAGDLFLDCSGFRALLIGETLDAGWESYARWLPCDRALAVPSASTMPRRPYTQAIAHAAGWQWRIPLQHRTGNGLVYASAQLSDDAAADLLLANLESAATGEPRPIRFATGRRAVQWSHNVVALGLAAGFLEPLESTSLHLIQQGIAELVRYLPAGDAAAAARAHFNRRMAFEFDAARDMLVAHYHLNRREGPLWAACREMALPDSLAERLQLFRERGEVVRRDEELFTPVGWQQVLTGQGVVPRRWHPLADVPSAAELDEFMALAARDAAGQATQVPPHDAYLAQLSATKTREVA